ncbi:DUF6126 family protein [Streptomyces fradiae]|uniref:Small hydrophobic protein n=3 Tax=Streptomyces TaxID=1883 RepID=A0A1D8G9M6_9ACTN|nr:MULTISPECIES: DUF6126 family protein [Streptomyces]AOT62154.1 hypothetical protein A4G23_05047 [Streptomyces rubrolavendulae]KAF0648251.1 hypothetical protein K701_19475 [Streptomyces fradiae ATCC 10745 = DSM 40063]OSY53315.1 hypothetical protein BG846_01043 [Streptomyces fradiae ATCC 10745 = DSM 40063]UQS29837.1 hypothetical protein J5J01_23565 [Streptomyces fradiae]WOI61429.1 DUF6126 family protein [Streptomyces fradiae]
MPEPENPQPIPSTQERWINRNLVIRLFAYLVAGHLFAAFLYLLFMLGGQNQ